MSITFQDLYRSEPAEWMRQSFQGLELDRQVKLELSCLTSQKPQNMPKPRVHWP